jgi:hypothetical protein
MRVASLAVSALLFGFALLLPAASGAPQRASNDGRVAAPTRMTDGATDVVDASEAPLCVADLALGCGETRCTRDADCPSNCGGCITWSGTCALFRPQ